ARHGIRAGHSSRSDRVQQRAGDRVRSSTANQGSHQVDAVSVRLPRLVFLVLATIGFAPGVPARQDWRAPYVASFDEGWQTINDTFPDPSCGGLDGRGVQAELRPRVRAAATPETARAVIREMLARLHRSHYALLSAASPVDAVTGDAMVQIDVRVVAAGVV